MVPGITSHVSLYENKITLKDCFSILFLILSCLQVFLIICSVSGIEREQRAVDQMGFSYFNLLLSPTFQKC